MRRAPRKEKRAPAGEDGERGERRSRQRDRQVGPRPAGVATARPIVAVVGRPNVGKSTLFNKLVGRRLALVEDVPGVTRDRHYADALLGGREVVLVDTGGFDPGGEDPLSTAIASQVRLAIDEADVVLCVLDGAAEPTPADIEAVALLRRSSKPVLYVANKVDAPSRASSASALYRLGIARLFPASALHGSGLGDLEDAIAEVLDDRDAQPTPPEAASLPEEEAWRDLPRIALVGRPNAGKSSLANRLLGDDRLVVDERPGTTRDAIDVVVERDGHRLVLVDTAGMRKKRAVAGESLEAMSVMSAIRALERSDIAVLVIDAEAGIGEQDLKVLALAVERGRGCIIALNKWDLVPREEHRRRLQETEDRIVFARWVPIVTMSAKTGRGVGNLLGAIASAREAYARRVPTAQLNRFFEQVLAHHPPPTHKGKAVRLYYVTQASTAPPTFVAISNHPEAVAESYRRYVAGQIRKTFGFEAVPVRVFYRPKRRRSATEAG